ARTGGRGEDLPVPEADQAHVVVLRRDADRADRHARDERRLADDDVVLAFVGRPVEAIRAEVNGIRVARPERHRSVEEDAVAAADAVERYIAGATEEGPAAVLRIRGAVHAGEADQVIR